LERRVVVRYKFMDVHGSPDMTGEEFGAGFCRITGR